MNTKGRCRTNGAQLGNYLSSTKDNVRADFLASYGATSNDPRRHLLEMSLTSELSSRSDKGLYHMQLSPRAHEAADMTWEQKLRSVEITAEQMGLTGHKWSLWEHEKADGRIHMHLVFERYNHDTGRMWDDDKNYDKHMAASRQMEKEFGWQLTHENKNNLDKGVKQIITEMYGESDTPTQFIDRMGKAGFEVTQGIDRRPFQIVDQYGKVHDLTRQITGANQADVSAYLNSVRKDLRQTAEASHDRRKQHQKELPVLEQSDNSHDLSDSQDLAYAMLNREKQQDNKDTDQLATFGYSFKFEQVLNTPLPYSADQKEKIQSDKSRGLSDSEILKLQMLKDYQRQQQIYRDRKNRLQEVKEQAKTETQPANDNNLTDEAAQMLEEYKRQQARFKQARGRSRDEPEY